MYIEDEEAPLTEQDMIDMGFTPHYDKYGVWYSGSPIRVGFSCVPKQDGPRKKSLWAKIKGFLTKEKNNELAF